MTTKARMGRPPKLPLRRVEGAMDRIVAAVKESREQTVKGQKAADMLANVDELLEQARETVRKAKERAGVK